MTGDVSTYGVYSFKTEEAILDYKRGPKSLGFLLAGLTAVFGTVAIWGQVVEHELGYRSEFAKIKSLDSAFGLDSNGLDGVKAYYKV
jgi:hypothetical protein